MGETTGIPDIKNSKNGLKVLSSSSWRIGSCQNIGARKQQQDSLGFAEGIYNDTPVLLAVLADGMGGMFNGAEFSRITVETTTKYLQKMLDRYQNPANVLLALAVEANRESNKIYDPENPGGTTLVAALFIDKKVYTLSIGDSRISLIRRKAALQMNRDHVFGAILDERSWMGIISREDAEDSVLRDKLLSSIGEPVIRRIDLNEHPSDFLPGDRLILMSDGIYRALSDEEIIAEQGKNPQTAAEKIVQRILDKNISKQDNMSILIIEKTGMKQKTNAKGA